MEVGQGPNWAVETKEKKVGFIIDQYVTKWNC
jgi:hypothetical protein